MKKLSVLLTKFLMLVFILLLGYQVNAQQNAFEMYATATNDWKAAIFTKYIKDYANIDVDALLISYYDISTIEEELKFYNPKILENDFEAAAEAVNSGKKVFFFIDKYVWGGLETGSTFSGSWQLKMPMCSGFYPSENKCFQNEGINYHCGKKESAHPVRFYIMK